MDATEKRMFLIVVFLITSLVISSMIACGGSGKDNVKRVKATPMCIAFCK